MATKPAKKVVKKAVKKQAKNVAHRNDGSGNVRSLTKVSGGASYAITLPREVIRAFKWKERQKLTLAIDTAKKTITIKDWKK